LVHLVEFISVYKKNFLSYFSGRSTEGGGVFCGKKAEFPHRQIFSKVHEEPVKFY